MSKSLLTVLTTAFALLTGVSYAAEKIAFTCSDEQNEAYSFVFDLDRKIVSSSMKTGDVMPITMCGEPARESAMCPHQRTLVSFISAAGS